MKYGKDVSFEIIEKDSTIEVIVSGILKGMPITPMDFGKDLARRSSEGVEMNPAEEIDVVKGIEEEFTTGEDIHFIYKEGSVSSCIILVGTLVKRMYGPGITARCSEVGGITTDEKNDGYIKIALQKMAMQRDSLSGVIECEFPWDIDLALIRTDFTKLLFEVIPEVTAIEFGHGVKCTKETASAIGPAPNSISIYLLPDMSSKTPCLSTTKDVVVEALANIVAINNL